MNWLCALLIFILSFIPTATNAKFAGIPWGTELQEAQKRLQELGFTVKELEDGTPIFKGKLAGEVCTGVIVEDQGKVVAYNISFHNSGEGFKSWITAKPVYMRIKNILKSKYGEPKSVEFFSDPYEEGDGYEFQAIKNDRGYYGSIWESNYSGSVTLAVVLEKFDEANIHLVYQSPYLDRKKKGEEKASEKLF